MQENVLDQASEGAPIYLQHLIWILGQPATWITLFLFGCLLIGIVKMAKRLWQRKSWMCGFGFLCIVGLVLGYYIWLSVNAVEFYREGRGSELVQLKIAKQIIFGLSLLSLVWIIISYVRKRKTRNR